MIPNDALIVSSEGINMNPESIWIDLKTISEIKGITTRALRLSLAKGKYTFRESITQGGKTSEILLSSLEKNVQEIYKNKYYSQIVEIEAQTYLTPNLKPEALGSKFIPDAAKTIALARLDLLNEWSTFRIKHKPKQNGDRLFLDLYNSGEYLKNLYELLGKTSRGSLLRWNKLYADYESIEALAPQYKYTGFNEYKTVLTEEQIGIFLKLLLHPNQFNIGEKFHKELHDKINGGYIPTIEEAIKLIDCWLDYRHYQPCPNVKGKTIKEVFETRQRQNIDISRLDDLMMNYEVKTIHRNGIRFLNTDYYNDTLYGLRDRVMIRYSLFDLSKIKVYSTKGEYLCTAKRVTGTHPMAYQMGEVKDMEDFKQKIQKQKRLKNRTLKAVKQFLPKEDIKFLEMQMDQENIPQEVTAIEIKPIILPDKLKPVFMNSYERYEWLMKNGCTSAEDRQWLQNYKNSEEYKMIYEE